MKSYTTINFTTKTIGMDTDRPARLNWFRVQISAAPDASATKDSYVPLFQFEAKAPSGSETPRMLFRSPPTLVPCGPVKTMRFKIPNAGFFQYNAPQTIVATMIISSSDSLAVTFNVFMNITYDFKSYQGLSDIFPPSAKKHITITRHRDESDDDNDDISDVSSAFSRLSVK